MTSGRHRFLWTAALVLVAALVLFRFTLAPSVVFAAARTYTPANAVDAGNLPGPVNNPRGVTWDETQLVIVEEHGSRDELWTLARNPDGTYTPGNFQDAGDLPGELDNPSGVAWDGTQLLIINDEATDEELWALARNIDGTYTPADAVGPADFPGDLFNPSGVTWDGTQLVIVHEPGAIWTLTRNNNGGYTPGNAVDWGDLPSAFGRTGSVTWDGTQLVLLDFDNDDLWTLARNNNGGYTPANAVEVAALPAGVNQPKGGTWDDTQLVIMNDRSPGPDMWTLAKDSTVPEAPDAPSLTRGDEELSVSWTAPDDGGETIIGYDTRYKLSTASDWTDGPSVNGTTTSATISSLTNGLSYDVQVGAENSIGNSEWSTSATLKVFTVPDAPGVPTVTGQDRQVEVIWGAPDNGGSTITAYNVEYRIEGVVEWTEGDLEMFDTETIITDRRADETYEVRVRAVNAAGEGDWSSIGTGTTTGPALAGDEPVLFTTNALDGFTVAVALTDGMYSINLQWDSNDDATGYEVETRDNGVFKRRTRISSGDFADMSNVVVLMKMPGDPVGNTDRGLSHTIVRVRAYKIIGVDPDEEERFSPWTDERTVTFPRYEYAIPTFIPGTQSTGDMIGAARLMGEITQPLGFEEADGQDYIVPLLFMAALIAAGATTWVVSGGGASLAGLVLGGLIFILIWSVAGPLWFDLHLGLALTPVVLVAVFGIFAGKKMAEG